MCDHDAADYLECGWGCDDWVGFNCSAGSLSCINTQAAVLQLLRSCPRSCGACALTRAYHVP